MSLLDRITEIARGVVTTDLELKQMREQIAEVKQEMRSLQTTVNQLSERLTRMETLREADHAQLRAEVAEFKLEWERARLRQQHQAPSAALPQTPENTP